MRKGSHMRSVTVGTTDFRAALQAVRVHACTDPELPDIARIRLSVDPVNVTITATDRFTLGLAIVSVLEQPNGNDAYDVDLLPDDVSKILSIFKGGKEPGDSPEFLLRLDVTEQSVTVTDCSGLIDGRALKIPRLPTSEQGLSGVPVLLAKAHFADLVMLGGAFYGGEKLARFKAAAVQYGAPLILEAHEGTNAVMVRCGESFLGMIMPASPTEEGIFQAKEWSTAWDTRLPEVDRLVPEDDGEGGGLVEGFADGPVFSGGE